MRAIRIKINFQDQKLLYQRLFTNKSVYYYCEEHTFGMTMRHTVSNQRFSFIFYEFQIHPNIVCQFPAFRIQDVFH